LVGDSDLKNVNTSDMPAGLKTGLGWLTQGMTEKGQQISSKAKTLADIAPKGKSGNAKVTSAHQIRDGLVDENLLFTPVGPADDQVIGEFSSGRMNLKVDDTSRKNARKRSVAVD